MVERQANDPQSWADLGIPKPPGIVGESIADAITNAMGTDSDFLNNLILDDPTNSIKKSVSSIPLGSINLTVLFIL